MEPIDFLISSGIGAAAGFAAHGGFCLLKRNRRPAHRATDCLTQHEIAAAEKTVYGHWISDDFTVHNMTCEKYTMVFDVARGGWKVVGKPVGERPREEVLCEHRWIKCRDSSHQHGGVPMTVCSKCGIPKKAAYRIPSMEEIEQRRRVERARHARKTAYRKPA